MLVIRMQRTGRKGHAQFRVIVQDSRRTPTSGKIVTQLGSFDPHNKQTTLDKEKTSFYLEHGAQPSERVARLLQAEGVSLPAWVKAASAKQRTVRNADKRRSTRPAEEPASTEAAEPEAPAEATPEPETPSEGAETPAEEPADAPAAEEAPAEEAANAPEAEAPAAEEASAPAAETPEESAKE